LLNGYRCSTLLALQSLSQATDAQDAPGTNVLDQMTPTVYKAGAPKVALHSVFAKLSPNELGAQKIKSQQPLVALPKVSAIGGNRIDSSQRHVDTRFL
jgi:hypothetical protein